MCYQEVGSEVVQLGLQPGLTVRHAVSAAQEETQGAKHNAGPDTVF